MMRLITLLLSLTFCLTASAAVKVNRARPVTHRVVVQPIIVSKTNGVRATYMGNASSRRYIQGQVRRIWRQSGVSVAWLPPKYIVDDFAYDGASAAYNRVARPTFHLDRIVNSVDPAPDSANVQVLNMFFVGIAPGFKRLNLNSAAGLAYVDSNGVTVYVGRRLVGFREGRDVVAQVIAHEIGHNLGLPHVRRTRNNLMAARNRISARLTNGQRLAVFRNHSGFDGYDLLTPIAPRTSATLASLPLPAPKQTGQSLLSRATSARLNQAFLGQTFWGTSASFGHRPHSASAHEGGVHSHGNHTHRH